MEGNVSVPFLSAQCPKFDHGYTVRGGHPTPEWERFTFHRRNPCICNNLIFLQLAKIWNRYWFNFRTPFNSSCGSWDGMEKNIWTMRSDKSETWPLSLPVLAHLNIIFLIYIMVSIVHFPKISVNIKWDVMQSLLSNRVLKWSKVLVAQSCPTLCGSTRLLCPWDVPGKNTGVGCHSLLQGIFWTQGSNSGLALPADSFSPGKLSRVLKSGN